MNRKGFTLVELLATLLALGLVIGLGTFSISNVIKQTKVRSEEAFIETIKDAMDIYISSSDVRDGNRVRFAVCSSNPEYSYAYILNPSAPDDPTRGTGLTFDNVVNSRFKPIKVGQLVNPANNKRCVPTGGVSDIPINIYRSSNSSYYYKISKSSLNGCFKHTVDSGNTLSLVNYISNLEDPGNFTC